MRQNGVLISSSFLLFFSFFFFLFFFLLFSFFVSFCFLSYFFLFCFRSLSKTTSAAEAVCDLQDPPCGREVITEACLPVLPHLGSMVVKVILQGGVVLHAVAHNNMLCKKQQKQT